MKIAFHYHTPLAIVDGRMRMPGYLGLFVDALAANVDRLYLVLHQADGRQIEEADYFLTGQNIRWINIGKKTPAWHRSLRYRSILEPFVEISSDVDMLLLRGPSPLAPFFSRFPNLSGRIVYMVVSDYGKGANFIPKRGLRNQLVRFYSHWIDRLFKKSLTGQLVIANSREIYEELLPLTERIYEIKTTTLSVNDFYERENTCIGDTIRLLFTGRIVVDKGLREIVHAVAELRADGLSIDAHFVGWEENETNSVTAELLRLAAELDIAGCVYFHGRKNVGPELNEAYRMADIYVLPSYHEGFPRTIWEAMANSIPVIASKVGSIPAYLDDNQNCLLVEPGDVTDIVEKIRLLAENKNLRAKLIENGRALARENTLDVQTQKLVSVLRSHKMRTETNGLTET